MKMRTTPQLEARLVAGMFNRNKKAQSELYAYCSKYFWANYRGVFFANEETATEIFQNTFIAFWENIERRKIYASEDRVMGKNDEPLSGSILTYNCTHSCIPKSCNKEHRATVSMSLFSILQQRKKSLAA